MTNLVAELREFASEYEDELHLQGSLARRAADEIERLRAALSNILGTDGEIAWFRETVYGIAEKALGHGYEP